MKKFSITDDTMVVTSTYVIDGRLPIVEISHEDDEEGGSQWQFHCGNGDYSMEQMLLVRLSTVLAIDPTIHQVADLKIGETAKRDAVGSPWTIQSK